MTISKKHLDAIKKIRDEDIDFSDIPETDAAFWAEAEVVMPQPKKAISLRIDPDVFDWFQKAGKGYQTHINAVLRSYMEAHKGRDAR